MEDRNIELDVVIPSQDDIGAVQSRGQNDVRKKNSKKGAGAKTFCDKIGWSGGGFGVPWGALLTIRGRLGAPFGRPRGAQGGLAGSSWEAVKALKACPARPLRPKRSKVPKKTIFSNRPVVHSDW